MKQLESQRKPGNTVADVGADDPVPPAEFDNVFMGVLCVLSYLQGILSEAYPQYIIVQVGGLGVKAFIPASFYFDLPETGAAVTVHTVMLIKDDEAVLYGFSDTAERDFFKIMLKVSGIGPKVALALIGHLTLPRLLSALNAEDVHALTAVPGIGNKTAQRLIYELKEKVAALKLDGTIPHSAEHGGSWPTVEEALLGLGYSPKEVAQARNRFGEEKSSVEELFKKALTLFVK